MIKTLSPYYITVPFVNPTTTDVCNSFVLKLYVWNGAKNAVPSAAEYEKTVLNASASNGSTKLEVGRMVNDFIEFQISNPGTTSLEDGNNQVWVKWEVYYDDQPLYAQEQNITLAVKGYGWFLDGQNPDVPVNNILLTGDEFKVSRNGFFVLPIVVEETTPPTPSLVIDSITLSSGELYDLAFTTNITYTDIYYRYSLTGLNDWTIGFEIGTASPFEITLPGTDVTYDVQIFTFDPLTSETVYSPIFTIYIP